MEYDDPPGLASGRPPIAQDTPLTLEGHEFDRPLAELSSREPVSCEPGTRLRDALEMMRRERVGSIVVVDALKRPLGIITLGDVLARVTLPQIPLETPVGEVMSVNLSTAPAHAPAFEAALLMARQNIRHVPLVSDGRLVGVVSESRLFALWRRSIGAVRAGIVDARDVDAVVQAAQGIRGLPAKLLAAGLTADAVTALLTSLNDMLVERLLDLTGAGAALREVHGCWIALGSQGRCEQTLATDQDNAILFDAAVDPDACRRTLLPLALEVNRALDRCGFPLCRGDIMASNPAWCLSQAEWKARFASWIDRPDAQSLLNAAIFFDFRPIGGAHPLVGELRAWLAGHARGSDLFVLQMVMNAQDNEPPLGLLRDFVLQRGGEHPNTLDLKTNGVQAFVEAARIYALASGVQATNTVERFSEAARARGLQERESAAWCDAFRTLQRIRLELNMRQLEQGIAMHNFLDPERLNILDRHVLKESLRQARSVQSRLTLDFARGGSHV
jgi:CBS domain-containing protein